MRSRRRWPRRGARCSRGWRGEPACRSRYIDHAAPAPLEDLWARDDLGAAFMCGFPFASAARKPRLLAAPVPSPPRYGGRPRYCTDFVVRADRRFAHLRDTFGGRIGWTVEHSQSGYNAVRHHLLRAAGAAAAVPQWVGPLVTPRRVIDAVLDGRDRCRSARFLRARSAPAPRPGDGVEAAGRRIDRHDADPAAGRLAVGRR